MTDSIEKSTSGIDWEALKRPFEPHEIDWRIQKKGLSSGRPWGMCLAYLTSRAVQDRLDEVVGPENWQMTDPMPVNGSEPIFSYQAPGYNGVKSEVCVGKVADRKATEVRLEGTLPGSLLGFQIGLSIRINGEWVTKWDGADLTDFEEFKGGISSAVKRAAVHWGIGRYLYNLKDTWAVFDGPDVGRSIKSEYISGSNHNWLPPLLTEKFLPEGWSGDQYEHLLKGSKPSSSSHAPAAPAVSPATSPAAKPSASNAAAGTDEVFKAALAQSQKALDAAAAAKTDAEKQATKKRIGVILTQAEIRHAEKKLTDLQFEQIKNLLASAKP